MKPGSLNLLEPSGPHRVCCGTALPFYTKFEFKFFSTFFRFEPEKYSQQSGCISLVIKLQCFSWVTIFVSINLLHVHEPVCETLYFIQKVTGIKFLPISEIRNTALTLILYRYKKPNYFNKTVLSLERSLEA